MFIFLSLVLVYVGFAVVCSATWWTMDASNGPKLSYWHLKHHFKCRGGGKEWEDIDCDVFDDPHPMTMALSVLVTIEMLNALNSLSENQSLIKMPPWTNKYLLFAIALSMSLHMMILYIPMFNTVFQICPLTWEEWFAVLKISFPVILLDETLKFVARRYVDKTEADKNMLHGVISLFILWAIYLSLIIKSPIFETWERFYHHPMGNTTTYTSMHRGNLDL
jgi:Ca2+ transporting ATPase